MEKYKLICKLQSETNISYEEAKSALEKNNWDVLDTMLYLEENNIIQKPSTSIFYTNEHKKSYKYENIDIIEGEENSYNNSKKHNSFEGIFELVCKIIDICNNILFEIKRENKVFIKIPITVIILLLIFAFWIVIPLAVLGLFFNLEFSVSRNGEGISKVNNVFNIISINIRKVKKVFKND